MIHMNSVYDHHCIVWRRPDPWSPRSSDLTCLDFFSQDHIKNMVHGNTKLSEEHLVPDSLLLLEMWVICQIFLLRTILKSTYHRCESCMAFSGHYFEQQL